MHQLILCVIAILVILISLIVSSWKVGMIGVILGIFGGLWIIGTIAKDHLPWFKARNGRH